MKCSTITELTKWIFCSEFAMFYKDYKSTSSITTLRCRFRRARIHYELLVTSRCFPTSKMLHDRRFCFCAVREVSIRHDDEFLFAWKNYFSWKCIFKQLMFFSYQGIGKFQCHIWVVKKLIETASSANTIASDFFSPGDSSRKWSVWSFPRETFFF